MIRSVVTYEPSRTEVPSTSYSSVSKPGAGEVNGRDAEWWSGIDTETCAGDGAEAVSGDGDPSDPAVDDD